MSATARLTALAAAVITLVVAAAVAQGGTTPRLIGKTGPAFVITLKTPSGQKASRVKAGTYNLVVTDGTGVDKHNFHMRGPGVDVKTGIPFVGRKTFRVRLQRGKTYRFLCDPHELAMNGSFKTF
ncbi:MAG: hypothetical protein H0T39_11685 [Actinobacteria bacterium]|nr:hypothetical protein [Actinomycetota bacterium]